MIVGVGVDLAETARVARALERTPAFGPRVFSAGELALPVASLAARWAAREAAIKALGGRNGLSWLDLAVARDADRPRFAGSPALTTALEALEVDALHLSLSHDDGHAIAMVVAERFR